MTINEGVNFLFANETSESHNVFLCSAFGTTSRSGNVENRTLITTKNALEEIFNFHGTNYTSPLQLDIIITQPDGSYIDSNKERELKKWLLKNKRQWLQVDQSDLADVMYYCMATKADILDVGTYSGGMLLSFECDTYHAWSGLKKKTYTTSGGILNFKFNCTVDYDEYIVYPTLIITPSVDGDITISNTTTNETITLTDCVTTEVITLDCKTDKIQSTSSRTIIDAWNKGTIGFIEGNNDIALSGNFSMELQYRLPARVGA